MTQLYPALDTATEAALRASIERFGVLLPIVVDQEGQLLDGHHRTRIAGELGVDCPRVTRHVADDEERQEIARTLNEDRRMLARSERLPVVRALRENGHSTRAIAGALRVSKSLVHKDLQQEVSTGGQVTGLDGKSYPAQREQRQPRTYEVRSEKARLNANAAARRVSNALSSIDGYCTGLANLDLPRAIAGATPDDLASWERVASETGRVLSQFRRALKEATT